jgi:hypothetical protein
VRKQLTRIATLWVATLWVAMMAHAVFAEVYRWTDDEGNVHYSDRKLATNAEDITAKVKIHNIDSSQEEQQKLQQIFRAENDADREFYRQQQERNKPSAELTEYCKKLRTHLRKVSGRVQIINKEGKEVRFTERERQAHAQEVQQRASERCSNVP